MNATDIPMRLCSTHTTLRSNVGSIPVLKVCMPDSVREAVNDVLFSGYIGEGSKVKSFEERLRVRLNVPNALVVNSGTSAIRLALRLAGVGPGDEVISTPMTCVAANQSILAAGARVRWADIDPDTGNIDSEAIARSINSHTRAIMVMHWGGRPCELRAVQELADRHGLKTIEDACHAFGSVYEGQLVGVHSDYVCFSFQSVKMMTTGDGGALVCRDDKDAERGRLLRWHGLDRDIDSGPIRTQRFFDQEIKEFGYRYSMNDIAAAIGLEQLRVVDQNIEKHRSNARQFDSAFGGMRVVRRLKRTPNTCANDWLYTLRMPNRVSFMDAMARRGIDASPVHVRNDRYKIFKDSLTELPGVDLFDPQHVCIPVGWWLTQADVDTIIQAVQEFDAAQA